MTPMLFAVRVVYYNFALIGAAFGGVAVASALGVPALSMVVAMLVAVETTLAFPAVAGEFYRRYDPEWRDAALSSLVRVSGRSAPSRAGRC
jgi:predicted glycosyltransferase